MCSQLLIPVHRKSRDAGSVDGMAAAKPLRFYFTSRETVDIGPNNGTAAVASKAVCSHKVCGCTTTRAVSEVFLFEQTADPY
jgi:hypothetical protein